jgi:hypothetical protein
VKYLCDGKGRLVTAIEILRRLYSYEMNVRIQSFWDGGYEFALGDDMNGFSDEETFEPEELEEGFQWLLDRANERVGVQ